ncbi:helix-turn-helix domain-containing protein [Sphingomonas sp. Leaf231]|uniref:helix-turn-helix domain-containing protein n=1 Tax=Sphingomonas sp. Leaf231 TaxID=1736301 RepID=UPI001F19B894|nr:helix-turn-helix domain-containing protein [Sphingomonas sp. Leaf231]
MLIGDRRQVLDAALEVTRRGGRLSVIECDVAMLSRLAASGTQLLTVEPGTRPSSLAARSDDQIETAPPQVEPLVGCTLTDVERALILVTLAYCHGNRTSAAQVLGISVRTMRNKLRLFLDEGIDVPPAPVHGLAGRSA